MCSSDLNLLRVGILDLATRLVARPYDPNGGYVDVTGYQSGSKVKDPYSQKIFLVP